ncbi:MAG: YfiR family protein [Breznakibacter sp.]
MKKGIFTSLLVMLFISIPSVAQEAKFKATFTLNFIRYIGFPDESTKGDFVIGVLRSKEIADHLKEQSAGKKFGFQDVVIKEFKSIEEITPCQVVFVSSYANYGKNAVTIAQKAGKNSLIVTESEGATGNGAVINFVVRDEKLKFEIHKANAGKAGLQISSKLEGMASAINL